MRYQIPSDDECIDLLTDAEFKLCRTERAAIERGRAKAWEMHKENGPSGRLRTLSMGAVGDSVMLEGYTSSKQISQLIASVSIAEGAQFRCALERSLIDGAVVGVRVTLAGFTR